MPIATRYLYLVSMDVQADKEDLFNEVYDGEHIPYLKKVPGVHAVTRAKAETFKVMAGGQVNDMPVDGPTYHAMYEIDSPDVVASPEWDKAVASGRWMTEVRPFCINRHFTMLKIR